MDNVAIQYTRVHVLPYVDQRVLGYFLKRVLQNTIQAYITVYDKALAD